jgi:hypothetical protein
MILQMQNILLVMVVYNDVIDDADDADLPVTATRVKHLNKFVEDGGEATERIWRRCFRTNNLHSNLELINGENKGHRRVYSRRER